VLDTCAFHSRCRYWVIGGTHSTAAIQQLVSSDLGGEYERLRTFVNDQGNPIYARLYQRVSEISMNLTIIESKMVRVCARVRARVCSSALHGLCCPLLC
jgi:hypothetical protein